MSSAPSQALELAAVGGELFCSSSRRTRGMPLVDWGLGFHTCSSAPVPVVYIDNGGQARTRGIASPVEKN